MVDPEKERNCKPWKGRISHCIIELAFGLLLSLIGMYEPFEAPYPKQ